MVVERAGAGAHVIADAVGQLAGETAEVTARIANVVVDQGRAARLAASVVPRVTVAVVAADIDAGLDGQPGARFDRPRRRRGQHAATPPSMPPHIVTTTPQANTRRITSRGYASPRTRIAPRVDDVEPAPARTCSVSANRVPDRSCEPPVQYPVGDVSERCAPSENATPIIAATRPLNAWDKCRSLRTAGSSREVQSRRPMMRHSTSGDASSTCR